MSDAAGRQGGAIAGLGKVRLTAIHARRPANRLVERQVFERVERVVVNEDADRPLRGKQVRRMIDGVAQLLELVLV